MRDILVTLQAARCRSRHRAPLPVPQGALTNAARSTRQQASGFMTPAAGIPDIPATFLTVGRDAAARTIALRARGGGPPGLFWLGGFNSDMRGTKALAIDGWAAEQGRACVRFDYSGHGESGGSFVDGTIGRWLEESVAVFEQFCRGPQVVIGSSMGGWMALLLARAIANRAAAHASLAGLVLIAPAPDF